MIYRNPQNPETFTVIFGMYRDAYEDEPLRDKIVKHSWLRALGDLGGSIAEEPNIHISKVFKYSGVIPIEDPDDDFWDNVRLSVEGRAYRDRVPDRVTIPVLPRVTLDGQANSTSLTDTIDTLNSSVQQYMTDQILNHCSCEACTDPDTHVHIVLSDTHVPQREDDAGTDEDDWKYPWTDPATWYHEYADED